MFLWKERDQAKSWDLRKAWKAWKARKTQRPGKTRPENLRKSRTERPDCRPSGKGSGSSTVPGHAGRSDSHRLGTALGRAGSPRAPGRVGRRRAPAPAAGRRAPRGGGLLSAGVPPAGGEPRRTARRTGPARLNRTRVQAAGAGIVTNRRISAAGKAVDRRRADYVPVIVVHEIATNDRSLTLLTDDGCAPGAVRPGGGRWRARHRPGRRVGRALRVRQPDRPARAAARAAWAATSGRRRAGRRRTPRSAAAPRRFPGRTGRSPGRASASRPGRRATPPARAAAPGAGRPRSGEGPGSRTRTRRLAVRGPRSAVDSSRAARSSGHTCAERVQPNRSRPSSAPVPGPSAWARSHGSAAVPGAGRSVAAPSTSMCRAKSRTPVSRPCPTTAGRRSAHARRDSPAGTPGVGPPPRSAAHTVPAGRAQAAEAR